jgi:hypothetical protein
MKLAIIENPKSRKQTLVRHTTRLGSSVSHLRIAVAGSQGGSDNEELALGRHKL